MINIFSQKTYKAAILALVGESGRRSGKRSALANAIGVQSAYLARVLNSDAHLSAEQALLATEHFGFNELERDFFMLLLKKDRAGTQKLKRYYLDQIDVIKEKQGNIQRRLNIKDQLSEEDRAVYYSHWYYAAIHILVACPDYQFERTLSTALDLPQDLVFEVVEFLLTRKLIVREGEFLKPGPQHIHVGKRSKHVTRHHSNWRLRGEVAMEKNLDKNLHYTVVMSLSREDAVKLKENMIQMIKENMKVVEPSPEETVYCHTMDFFEVV